MPACPVATLQSRARALSLPAPDDKAKEVPERRRKRPKALYKCFSFDDVWMERSQKRKLEKETQPEGGVQLQHLPQDPSKVRSHTPTSSVSGIVFLSAQAGSLCCHHVPVLPLCLISLLSAFLWAWYSVGTAETPNWPLSDNI